MAVENMLLAATDEGFGNSVYTFLDKKEENELKKTLHASQNARIACIVQLGYKEIEPISSSRKKIGEIVPYEHL